MDTGDGEGREEGDEEGRDAGDGRAVGEDGAEGRGVDCWWRRRAALEHAWEKPRAVILMLPSLASWDHRRRWKWSGMRHLVMIWMLGLRVCMRSASCLTMVPSWVGMMMGVWSSSFRVDRSPKRGTRLLTAKVRW